MVKLPGPDILAWPLKPLIHRIGEYDPFEKVMFGNFLVQGR